MVSKRKKKYSTGEGAQFISRKQALKKLQLSLNDFRRICILKGIYPREPRNRKRAQSGQAGIKTLYHIKDIQFLLHEPNIWKLRDIKSYNKKVGKARAIKDNEKMKRYMENHPILKLDHIIKERYPTFIDALRDLDDCLTLCCLFSTFPSLPHVPRDQSALCQRLTLEFMHAVITDKALRKVFVSIKGYYFQAELRGQTITWIMPHHFSFEPQNRAEVDFKVMSIFVEFYTILLGFVNFRLYNLLNLHYPPKFNALGSAGAGITREEKALVDEQAFVSERIAALNFPISRIDDAEEVESLDVFDTELVDCEKLEEARIEAEKIKKLKTLFNGMKFYLNREVPREPLVFIIRCFGGEVSWDKLLFVGASFDEDDLTITHQIVDRPSMAKKYMGREYIQPQWVFDSVNARELLPVNKYFMGEVLPPHLSPFVDKNRDQQYIPPEERALYDPSILEAIHQEDKAIEENSGDDGEQTEDDENEKEKPEIDDGASDDAPEEHENDSNEEHPMKNKLSVTPGKVYKESEKEKTKQERLEYRLREKMVKKKHKKLYKSMMEGKQKRMQEMWLLNKKRKLYEENKKNDAKNANQKPGKKETKLNKKNKT